MKITKRQKEINKLKFRLERLEVIELLRINRNQVKTIAKRLGVKLNFNKYGNAAKHTWDGEILHVKGIPYCSIIHEFAHFQIATPKRRKMPDFGLGSVSSRKYKNSKRTVLRAIERDSEEALTQILEIIWMSVLTNDVNGKFTKFGYNGRTTLRQFKKYFHESPDICDGLKWLMEEGLIEKLPNGWYQPLYNLRQSTIQ